MQSILYHNSSGAQAFTGNLKKKEVHRAITLHPVKSPPHMYRLHNYMRVRIVMYNNYDNLLQSHEEEETKKELAVPLLTRDCEIT